MSERYYITGVQIGMINAFTQMKELNKIGELLSNIEENQFIGNITSKSDIITIARKR